MKPTALPIHLTAMVILSVQFYSMVVGHRGVSCSAGAFSLGQRGRITCHFGKNINASRDNFRIEQFPSFTFKDAGVNVLACNWEPASLKCSTILDGFVFNPTVTDSLQLEIPEVTKTMAGIILCDIVGDEEGGVHHQAAACNITVIDPPIGTSSTPNSNEFNQNDDSHISLHIGALVAIITVPLVVFLLLLVVIIVRGIAIRRKYRLVSRSGVVAQDADGWKDIACCKLFECFFPKSAAEAEEEGEELLQECIICRSSIRRRPKKLNCGDTFCKKCIDRWLQTNSTCPNCNFIVKTSTGQQPENGTMAMIYSDVSLPGYETENAGSYIIQYHFDEGVQKKRHKHPSPGRKYEKIDRTAYLPDTREGRKVLMLLKIAFDRRLIFTLAHSLTRKTNKEEIVWNGITHKTDRSGGSTAYGYPDDGYLNKVQEHLRDSFGITEVNLTPAHKRFIEAPVDFHGKTKEDFSQQFPVQLLES